MTTVKYPPKAAVAIGHLKSHSNDIDIFVEDKGNPNLWVKLLRRLIPSSIRLSSVTPLGGRAEVMRACKADTGKGGRRRLYIIDADMDLIMRRPKPKLRNLYRLRRYCVENYLIHESSFIEALTTLNPVLSEVDARSRTDVDGWLARNQLRLRDLFVSYATARDLGWLGSTISYPCHRLLRDTVSFDLCPSLTRARVRGIYKMLIQEHGVQVVRERAKTFSMNADRSEPLIYSSAKGYILPLLYEISKRVGSFSLTREAFSTILARFAAQNVDPYLKRRLSILCA